MRRIREITYYVMQLPRGSSLLREMYNLYSQNYTGSHSETRSLLDIVQSKGSAVSEKVVALWLLNNIPLDAGSRAEVLSLYTHLVEQYYNPSSRRQKLLSSRKRIKKMYAVVGCTGLAAIVAITAHSYGEHLLDKFWWLYYLAFLIVSAGVSAAGIILNTKIRSETIHPACLKEVVRGLFKFNEAKRLSTLLLLADQPQRQKEWNDILPANRNSFAVLKDTIQKALVAPPDNFNNDDSARLAVFIDRAIQVKSGLSSVFVEMALTLLEYIGTGEQTIRTLNRVLKRQIELPLSLKIIHTIDAVQQRIDTKETLLRASKENDLLSPASADHRNEDLLQILPRRSKQMSSLCETVKLKLPISMESSLDSLQVSPKQFQ